jgi:hypothetical protein
MALFPFRVVAIILRLHIFLGRCAPERPPGCGIEGVERPLVAGAGSCEKIPRPPTCDAVSSCRGEHCSARFVAVPGPIDFYSFRSCATVSIRHSLVLVVSGPPLYCRHVTAELVFAPFVVRGFPLESLELSLYLGLRFAAWAASFSSLLA